MVGGLAPRDLPSSDLNHSDAWLLNLHSKLWRKVDLPPAIAARCEHTVTSINVSSSTEQVMVYGGIGPAGKILAQPALLEVTTGECG